MRLGCTSYRVHTPSRTCATAWRVEAAARAHAAVSRPLTNFSCTCVLCVVTSCFPVRRRVLRPAAAAACARGPDAPSVRAARWPRWPLHTPRPPRVCATAGPARGRARRATHDRPADPWAIFLISGSRKLSAAALCAPECVIHASCTRAPTGDVLTHIEVPCSACAPCSAAAAGAGGALSSAGMSPAEPLEATAAWAAWAAYAAAAAASAAAASASAGLLSSTCT